MAAPFVYLCVQWVHCVFELSGSTGSAMQAIRGEHNGLYHVLSGVLNRVLSQSPNGRVRNKWGPPKDLFHAVSAKGVEWRHLWSAPAGLVARKLTSMYTGWQLSSPHEPWRYMDEWDPRSPHHGDSVWGI